MRKLVYWANIGFARQEVTAALQGLQDVEATVVESAEALAEHLPGAEGLVMSNPSSTEAAAIATALRGPHVLKWVHLIGAGMDGIPACGLPPHVSVTHTPGATANAVGDHALALLFSLLRALPKAWAQQQAGRWSKEGITPAVTSVEGKTVVILGHGAIGKYLHRVFSALDASVRVVSRTRPVDVGSAQAFALRDFQQAMTGADVLVVAVPLSEHTHGLVDDTALRAMRKASYVVNVGRGPIVNRHALLQALEDGHLAGAGIDVTDPEPLPPGDPLWAAPNLVITPHYGVGGQRAWAQTSCRAFAEHREGPPRQRLTGPVCLTASSGLLAGHRQAAPFRCRQVFATSLKESGSA